MKRISEIRYGLGVCLFVWSFLHLAGGCTQTEVEEKNIPPHALKDVEAVFNLNVLASQVPQTRSITFTTEGMVDTDTVPAGIKDIPGTRAATALPEGEESRIAQLWIGQYGADGSRIFSQYIPIMTGTGVNVKLKESQSAIHHVWFVANAGNLGEIATETALKEHVLTYASTAGGLPENSLCGMSGMWSGAIGEGGVENISVDMTRLVAKISFAYLIGGNGFSFTPTSVTLKSVPDKIRIEAMTTQLTDITYKSYTGTASSDGGTMYWYLPENRAGTVSGENLVDTEKKKTGKGVTNATYIELTGKVIQGGVTYENVSFRFYPGSGMNNYDIVRNSHYTMNVTLVGIDISDERITVSTIPPIDIGGLKTMPAGIGGTTELQITARPGQEWKLKLPDWLSALIDGKTQAGSGANISYQGPATLLFRAETANPRAEERAFSFPMNVSGEEQTIEIVQEASTMEAGKGISLGASSGLESSSSFIATEGLPWRAVLPDGGWLDWSATNPGYAGDAATGKEQKLIVKATSGNPYAKERTAAITVEGGESVGSIEYTGLKQEILVSQAGSIVTCPSTPVEVSAEGGTGVSSSFTATPGLSWNVAVPSENNWIILTGQTGGTTMDTPQNVTCDVPVNPNSTVRNGTITVRAGDENGGPTGSIVLQQVASSLTVDEISTVLEPTAAVSGSFDFMATKGLSYNIAYPNWLEFPNGTTGTTTGNKQTVGYKTNSVNKNKEAREGSISVTAGNITTETAVTQDASVFEVEPKTVNLPNTESSAEVTIKGTTGLPWTITRSEGSDGISAEPTSGNLADTPKIITISASENEGGGRSANFVIVVTGGNHSETVTVKQASGLNTITIDQTVADSYKNYQQTYYSSVRAYPFNYDNGNYGGTGPYGGDHKGNSANYTVDTPYTIEVEATQSQVLKQYITGLPIKACTDKGEGWRIPTIIELYAIWDKCKGSNLDATDDEPATYTFGDGFISNNYWSSSVGLPYYSVRAVINFTKGSFNTSGTSSDPGKNEYPVRCIREK